MRLARMLIFAAIAGIAFAATAAPPAATIIVQATKDDAAIGVLRALAQLEGQTEVGVSFVNYVPLVGTASAELKLYAMTPSGARHREAVAALRAAIDRYAEAAELWRLTFRDIGARSASIVVGSALDRDYAARYPDGARNSRMSMHGEPDMYIIKLLLPYLWKDAAEMARQAAALL
jgi:hypothetical protein